MSGDVDGLQQTTLWRLEDDFEGVSTQAQAAAAPNPVMETPLARDDRNGQPEGEITFDDGTGTYTYTGYVLEGGVYARRTFSFTPDEILVYPEESLERVCAMVDAVGRDAARQAEIKRFGKRTWHSPYRTQDAALQGLDYIFRHDVDVVAACYPYVVAFYADDAAEADRWTRQMFDAYKAFVLRREPEALARLLEEAVIPPQNLGIETGAESEKEEE